MLSDDDNGSVSDNSTSNSVMDMSVDENEQAGSVTNDMDDNQSDNKSHTSNSENINSDESDEDECTNTNISVLANLPDEKLMSMMASLREDKINLLPKEDIEVHLTAYTRQYMLTYTTDYFETADLPKIRNQLLRSSIELRTLVASKPPTVLDTNTTNEQLMKCSWNNAVEILQKYVDENKVQIDVALISKNGAWVIQECQKIRDNLRKDLGLPPMLAPKKPSWQQKKVVNRAESDFYRSYFNLNGCDLRKFLHHDPAVRDPRAALTSEGGGYVNPIFKENDFYVRALVPMSKQVTYHPSSKKRFEHCNKRIQLLSSNPLIEKQKLCTSTHRKMCQRQTKRMILQCMYPQELSQRQINSNFQCELRIPSRLNNYGHYLVTTKLKLEPNLSMTEWFLNLSLQRDIYNLSTLNGSIEMNYLNGCLNKLMMRR